MIGWATRLASLLLTALVVLVSGVIPASPSVARPITVGVSLSPDGAVGGRDYDYDSPTAATTSAANGAGSRTARLVARQATADGPRASTSWIRDFRAAKGADGAADLARLPVGRRGSPIEIQPGSNAPGEIAGRRYSGHALDRMQGRGIPPSAVEDAIANGESAPGRGGTTIHYSPENHISVVVGRDGRVVTVSYGDFRR